MIVHLTTTANGATLAEFAGDRAATSGVDLRQMTYPQLFEADPAPLPRAAWIFSDFDLLDPRSTSLAARIWHALAARGDRLLNHPARSMRRYELLRTLHDRGVNDFDVQLATDPRRPRRYPVFARWANAHSGPISKLIPDAAALERYLDRCIATGRLRDEMLIVELCDTREANGLIREYGAYCIGDRILPEHLWFSAQWAIKMRSAWDLGGARVDRAALLQEEVRYIAENPHEAELKRIFALARIDYGRIDYGLRDGRIQVWEINGNPLVSFDWVAPPGRDVAALVGRFTAQFGAALAALDRGLA